MINTLGFSHLFKAFTLLFLLSSLILIGCKEEVSDAPQVENNLEVNRQYRPFIHHFSSTRCGPCGRFGVPVLNKVADEMGDSIFAFITHFKYNDPFITSSSEAIEQAILDEWYSPQIWLENENRTFDLLGLEVYGMEDGIVASQAGPPSNVITHVRVNQGGFYGNMGKEITLDAGAEFRDNFEYIPCWTCNPSGIYFNAIVWKQNASGKYEYVNGLEVK